MTTFTRGIFAITAATALTLAGGASAFAATTPIDNNTITIPFAAFGQAKCTHVAVDFEVHKSDRDGNALAGASYEISLSGGNSTGNPGYDPAFGWGDASASSPENIEFAAALAEFQAGGPLFPRTRLDAANAAATAANEATLNRGTVTVTTDSSGAASIPTFITTTSCIGGATVDTVVTVVETVAPAGFALDATPMTATLLGATGTWEAGRGFDAAAESFTQANDRVGAGVGPVAVAPSAPKPVVNG